MTKLDRIVIGVDFSEPSRRAARWVSRELAPDAEILLVHALELPGVPSYLGESHDQHLIVDEMQRAVLDSMQEIEEALPSERVTSYVLPGPASRELCDLADQEGADLIVVGPHGAHPRVQSLMGSTAERILSLSRLPVLLVTGRESGAPGKVLFPVDDPMERPEMANWGRDLIERFQARLCLFHAIDPKLFGRIRLVSSPVRTAELEAEALAQAIPWLQASVGALGLPAESVDVEVAVGRPTEEILDVAAAGEFDLILMGSRAERAVQRLLLGSVAHGVLHAPPCSVLMIPRPHR